MARQQGAGLTRTVVSRGSPPRAAGPRPSHSLVSGERDVPGAGLTRWQGNGVNKNCCFSRMTSSCCRTSSFTLTSIWG